MCTRTTGRSIIAKNAKSLTIRVQQDKCCESLRFAPTDSLLSTFSDTYLEDAHPRPLLQSGWHGPLAPRAKTLFPVSPRLTSCSPSRRCQTELTIPLLSAANLAPVEPFLEWRHGALLFSIQQDYCYDRRRCNTLLQLSVAKRSTSSQSAVHSLRNSKYILPLTDTETLCSQ